MLRRNLVYRDFHARYRSHRTGWEHDFSSHQEFRGLQHLDSLEEKLLGVSADRSVILDLSETRLVDHTVMEKLHELESDFEEKNRKFIVQGLDKHKGVADHPHAMQKRTAG